MISISRRLVISLALACLAGCGPEKKPEPKPTPVPTADAQPSTTGTPRATTPEKEAGPVLPFNPFAHAEEGDWSTMTVKHGQKDRELPGVALRTFRVTKVDGDAVTVEAETLVPSGARMGLATCVFSKSSAPTFAKFGRANGPIVNPGFAEDWHDCPGRKFVCKKIGFETTHETEPMTLRALIHPEVKEMGMVFVTLELGRGADMTWVDYELVGYGTAQGTTWGRSESDLVKPRAPATASPRSTYKDGSTGLSLTLPRFVGIEEGEAAHPAAFQLFAPDDAGPGGRILIKVTRTGVPTQEAVKAEVERQCSVAGMTLTKTAPLRIGDREGQVFEFENPEKGIEGEPEGHKYIYVSAVIDKLGFFVTCSAPSTTFEKYEASFRATLASIQLGSSKLESEASATGQEGTYVDRLYGYAISVPSLGGSVADKPRLLAEFASAPVREIVLDKTEICVLPASASREALRDVLSNLTGGPKRRGTITSSVDRTVSGHEAIQATLESVSDAAHPEATLEFMFLGIRDTDRTLVVSCACRKEEFEGRRAEFQACLDSVVLGK